MRGFKFLPYVLWLLRLKFKNMDDGKDNVQQATEKEAFYKDDMALSERS